MGSFLAPRGSGTKKFVVRVSRLKMTKQSQNHFTFFLPFCRTSRDRSALSEEIRGKEYSLRTIQRNAEGLIHVSTLRWCPTAEMGNPLSVTVEEKRSMTTRRQWAREPCLTARPIAAARTSPCCVLDSSSRSNPSAEDIIASTTPPGLAPVVSPASTVSVGSIGGCGPEHFPVGKSGDKDSAGVSLIIEGTCLINFKIPRVFPCRFKDFKSRKKNSLPMRALRLGPSSLHVMGVLGSGDRPVPVFMRSIGKRSHGSNRCDLLLTPVGETVENSCNRVSSLDPLP